MSDPLLSVVCTLGPRRGRANRMLAALDAQTAADSIEVVLVDAGPPDQSPKASGEIPTTVLPYPPGAPLGEGRAAGLRAARGEVVAFLADHVYPEPGWAEALIRAYRERSWTAIGYAFRNANPDTYGSRASMLADFAPWLAPVSSGETGYLPPNDLSFRRTVLIDLGEELPVLLSAEPLLLEELQSQGHRLGVVGDAEVAHACLRTVRDNALASFDYCRALAGIQVQRERWRIGGRLAHALLSGLGAPLMRTAGNMRTLFRKSNGGLAIRCLPAILIQHIVAGFGQAWGYIAGGGGAAARFPKWEMAAERDDR